MQNGIYRVVFQGPLSSGRGILVAKNGSLWGGDSGYVYNGSYTTQGPNRKASIQVKRDDPNSNSIFGSLPEFTLDLSFALTSSGFQASGTIPGYSNARIEANATKTADL